MEIIPQWLTLLTPMGTLLLIVVLIARGELIPRSIHERIVNPEREARALAEAKAENAEAREDRLVSTLETHTRLLEAIRASAEGGGRDA